MRSGWLKWSMVPVLCVLGCAAAAQDTVRRIALIGDSTVCTYPQDSRLRGWGQLLPKELPWVDVLNEAEGGRSTKTFPLRRWRKVLEARPEYVLIQFGHNDSHAKSLPESTEAGAEYKTLLARYVSEARAAGIVPILVTPPHRRLFRDGQPSKELEPYANAMKETASENGVAVIDLYDATGRLFMDLGEKGSEPFTANRPPDAPQGTGEDRTHFTEYGARELAKIVASQLAAIWGHPGASPDASPR